MKSGLVMVLLLLLAGCTGMGSSGGSQEASMIDHHNTPGDIYFGD